jgi:hypothetical protein
METMTEPVAETEQVTAPPAEAQAPEATTEQPTEGQPATEEKAPATTEAEGAVSSDKKNIFDRSKYHYAKSGVKTGSGRPAVDNGDAVAVAIRGKTAAEVCDLVKANGEEVPSRWSELNLGMQRMNAANVLRRLAKSEGGVQIDGNTIKIAVQAPVAAAAA